jgi:CDP-diglyceride synthetase
LPRKIWWVISGRHCKYNFPTINFSLDKRRRANTPLCMLFVYMWEFARLSKSREIKIMLWTCSSVSMCVYLTDTQKKIIVDSCRFSTIFVSRSFWWVAETTKNTCQMPYIFENEHKNNNLPTMRKSTQICRQFYYWTEWVADFYHQFLGQLLKKISRKKKID